MLRGKRCTIAMNSAIGVIYLAQGLLVYRSTERKLVNVLHVKYFNFTLKILKGSH